MQFCISCGHIAHDNRRCGGGITSEQCVCNYPEFDNFADDYHPNIVTDCRAIRGWAVSSF